MTVLWKSNEAHLPTMVIVILSKLGDDKGGSPGFYYKGSLTQLKGRDIQIQFWMMRLHDLNVGMRDDMPTSR